MKSTRLTVTALLLTSTLLSCGEEKSKKSPTPQSNDIRRENVDGSSDNIPEFGENPCKPLPELNAQTYELYGDWRAPSTARGELKIESVIAFRPGAAIVQLTCRHPKGSICVEQEYGLIATERTFMIKTTAGEDSSRTISGVTCSMTAMSTSSRQFDTYTYKVHDTILEFTDRMGETNTLSRVH